MEEKNVGNGSAAVCEICKKKSLQFRAFAIIGNMMKEICNRKYV